MFAQARPLIIAEIGGNHEGSFDRALELTCQALASGVDAIKYQVYRGDEIASSIAAPEQNAHFKRFELADAEWRKLAELCGPKFSASVWDERSLELIDPLVSFHKVGSGDLTNYPLLRKIARCDKPLIVSTAMARLDEVQETLAWIDRCNPRLRNAKELCLLHCVAMYGDPRAEYANLAAILTLAEAFPDVPIGYSDHTIGTLACEAAVTLGAHVLEKHFTDDKMRPFRDHAISATLAEMQHLVARSAEISVLLGNRCKRPIPEVETVERIKSFRRGVYARAEVASGTVLTTEHLTTLRPLLGVDARFFDEVVGRRLCRAKRAYDPIYADDLE
jgi:N-acetylneuraminate synthase/N,N'-diacetyllegionaminate synthase